MIGLPSSLTKIDATPAAMRALYAQAHADVVAFGMVGTDTGLKLAASGVNVPRLERALLNSL